MAAADAIAGTECPIDARLELGADPPRSIIIVSDARRAPKTQSLEDVAEAMRSRLEAEGPLTPSCSKRWLSALLGASLGVNVR
jgi:hypothetical protein